MKFLSVQLIHPSSGAFDFSVVSPHWLCVLVSMCVGEFRCGWFGVVSVWQASALDAAFGIVTRSGDVRSAARIPAG